MDLLALSMAAELRTVDGDAAVARLDALGAELARVAGRIEPSPLELSLACAQLLGREHGFDGDREHYDDPDNSMLDLVLSRRRGLPIVLSVVYMEVSRRAGIALVGVGLPGHFVVGHFGSDPPVLLDPFNGGALLETPTSEAVRPWDHPGIATRMLNNLVASYQRRGDLGRAIRAAELRLMLPSESSMRETMSAELRALRARLN
jgi:regulator of sirC expression with transglutaminase-like and TPR domain